MKMTGDLYTESASRAHDSQPQRRTKMTGDLYTESASRAHDPQP